MAAIVAALDFPLALVTLQSQTGLDRFARFPESFRLGW